MPPPLPPGQLGHSLGPLDARVTLGGHLDYVVRTLERAGTRASLTKQHFGGHRHTIVACEDMQDTPSEIVRSAPIPRRLTKPSEDKWAPTIRVKAFVLCFIIKCSRKLPPELLDASKQMLS